MIPIVYTDHIKEQDNSYYALRTKAETPYMENITNFTMSVYCIVEDIIFVNILGKIIEMPHDITFPKFKQLIASISPNITIQGMTSGDKIHLIEYIIKQYTPTVTIVSRED
jgi:hypothetical protein